MKTLTSLIPDALMVSGAGAISYGAWLIYEPSGYVIGGLLLIVGGVMAARAK